MKRLFLWLIGFLAVIAGVALILIFWRDVVGLFKAVVGITLGIIGLAMMSMARD